MKRTLNFAVLVFLLASCCGSHKDGEYTFTLLTTNDIHGRYFDSLYVGGNTRESLFAVNAKVTEYREKYGRENVILIDAGDAMQGDNAAYYFNCVDTVSRHLFTRMAEYMKYDALIVGNHDIETGHSVYDRVKAELDIPYLAANAVRTDNGKPYFNDYTVFFKNGFKTLVLGYTNANMKAWLAEKIFSGMDFLSLTECVQKDLDRICAKEKPEIVIVAAHTGTGPGDSSALESQGRDLLYSLKGIDFLVCAHDHRPFIEKKGSTVLINSGSHCRNLGHGVLRIEVKNGKIVTRSADGDIIQIDKSVIDTAMRDKFAKDYEAVREFTVREVGNLGVNLVTRASYTGMCPYIDLIQTVCLKASNAKISLAAPLTFNGFIPEGRLIYNDLFTIYPFENQLYAVDMTGKEIKDYLEYSYEGWINTVSSADDTLLKIEQKDDPRTGLKGWSFVGRSYNFDSAAGINYTVDVTKPAGERIHISSLADGSAFSFDSTYTVAMTSYRASGGKVIDKALLEDRTRAKLPEIRQLIYDYIRANPTLTQETVCDRNFLGSWEFIPAETTYPALKRDMHRLFPKWE